MGLLPSWIKDHMVEKSIIGRLSSFDRDGDGVTSFKELLEHFNFDEFGQAGQRMVWRRS